MKKSFILASFIALLICCGIIQGVQAYVPNVPTLSAPSNNASIPNQVVLRWNPVEGASGYYRFYKQISPSVGSENIEYVSTNQYSLPSLTVGNTYQWYIQACDDAGEDQQCSASSEMWIFTISTPSNTTGTSGGTTGTGETERSTCSAGQICNPLAYSNFEDLINAVINFLFTMSLVVAPIMLVIAGLLYVTSAVNPKQIDTAKSIILYTIIGFSVILLASGLVKVLQSVLGG